MAMLNNQMVIFTNKSMVPPESSYIWLEPFVPWQCEELKRGWEEWHLGLCGLIRV